MADAVIDIRVGNLEETVKGHEGRFDEVDGRLDEHSSEIARVRRWGLEGNGESAESRIKDAHSKIDRLTGCFAEVSSDEHIQKIASAAAKSIVANARDRDKTWVAKAGAVAKILTPLGAIIAAVAALVAVLMRTAS